MAEKLTEQQKQAVYDRGGKLLVSAAAGSGKTKVLVDRLLTYINDPIDPANVDDFLIITFTEAAAAELRSKIAAKLNEKIAEDPTNKHLQRQIQRLYLAKISTIHAFCSGVLKENAYRLDLSADFRLADDKEATELKLRIIEQLFDESYKNEEPDFFAFVDTQGLGRNDSIAPQIILDIYEKSRCHLNPDGWLDHCISNADISTVCDASETIWGQHLIKDLHELLDLLIPSMENCAKLVAGDPDLIKAEEVLNDNVMLLRDLRGRNTWKEIVAGCDVNFGTLRFHKNCDPYTKELIAATRDRCKKLLASKLSYFTDSNEQTLQDIGSTLPAIKGIVQTVKAFSKSYQKAKLHRHLVDFSDLEHMTLDLLVGKNRDTFTVLADELGAGFREVMVDEYQDTNEVQDCIFNALTRKRQNCFMVGDIKQSIYQFRLADPRIFINKYNTYVPAIDAVAGEGRKVVLSSNFRSSGGVIDAVNDVFSNFMSPKIGGLYYTDEEMLNEGIPHQPLSEPEVEFYAVNVEHDRYTEEAAFVAQRIKQMLDGKHLIRDKDQLRPITPEDIVILLRAPGSVGIEYQSALANLGIRCVSEKSNDLLKTEEISVFRSLLQCISNPLQDIPLVAALTSCVIGMTANELAEIRITDKYSCYYDALRASDLPKAIAFCDMLKKLRRFARTATLSELLDEVLNTTSMDSIFGAKDDGKERVNNVFLFCQLAATFESNRQGDLERFLDYLDNLENGNGYTVSDDSYNGAVRIMSIHKSKGLEFPVVFACALSKKFNEEDIKAPVVCDSELGLGVYCSDLDLRVKYPNIARKAIINKMRAQSLSEEMRVLYVALTRAKDRLIMTYSRRNVEKHIHDLSLRMQLAPKELMALDVSSVGDWTLMTAMQRDESVCLFSDTPNCGEARKFEKPWHVRLVNEVNLDVCDTPAEVAQLSTVSLETVEFLKSTLSFVYPHKEATRAPSKQTATQLKGRVKDHEAADGTVVKRQITFRKPTFVRAGIDGRTYGNTMHTIMQHICYSCCNDLNGIEREIDRMVGDGLISSEHRKLVDTGMLADFFSSDLGVKLCSAKEVLREFKFSILDDGQRYVPGMTGEKVLLQGVVDCVIVEEDGLTIIDFKTDNVTAETEPALTKMYSEQVSLYAHAMNLIYELPIKAKALYYFRLGKFVYV